MLYGQLFCPLGIQPDHFLLPEALHQWHTSGDAVTAHPTNLSLVSPITMQEYLLSSRGIYDVLSRPCARMEVK